MKLFSELTIRVILIVSIIDAIEFYLISKKQIVITIPIVIGIIVITIIPIVISIWYCLHKSGLI